MVLCLLVLKDALHRLSVSVLGSYERSAGGQAPHQAARIYQQSAISNADERMQAHIVPLYPYHATNYKY